MGYTLTTVLPNIFMDYNETNWLNEHNLNFYLRYIDDIQAAFENEKTIG